MSKLLEPIDEGATTYSPGFPPHDHLWHKLHVDPGVPDFRPKRAWFFCQECLEITKKEFE